MQAPKLQKITVNMGVGLAKTDSKVLRAATEQLATIAGQQPSVRRARKSIAAFKLREGNPVGVAVTLRGDRGYEFLDRLVSIAIPRIRDFRGLNPRSFDGRGNYSLGIREQIIFPEIDYDSIDQVRGMDVTITTSAASDAEAFALLARVRASLLRRPPPRGFETLDVEGTVEAARSDPAWRPPPSAAADGPRDERRRGRGTDAGAAAEEAAGRCRGARRRGGRGGRGRGSRRSEPAPSRTLPGAEEVRRPRRPARGRPRASPGRRSPSPRPGGSEPEPQAAAEQDEAGEAGPEEGQTTQAGEQRLMAKTSQRVKQARPPKYKTQAYTRCTRCGRPRAVYRKFGVCRICLRELAHDGQIPGMTKSSW